jgi:hypothetical protein
MAVLHEYMIAAIVAVCGAKKNAKRIAWMIIVSDVAPIGTIEDAIKDNLVHKIHLKRNKAIALGPPTSPQLHKADKKWLYAFATQMRSKKITLKSIRNIFKLVTTEAASTDGSQTPTATGQAGGKLNGRRTSKRKRKTRTLTNIGVADTNECTNELPPAAEHKRRRTSQPKSGSRRGKKGAKHAGELEHMQWLFNT